MFIQDYYPCDDKGRYRNQAAKFEDKAFGSDVKVLTGTLTWEKHAGARK